MNNLIITIINIKSINTSDLPSTHNIPRYVIRKLINSLGMQTIIFVM